MGKGISIIAVIALIVGLGSGGFILYDNFIAISPAENEWYDPNTTVYYMPPGEAFGTPNNVRISYATSDDNLVKAMDRLEKALGELK